ncbi:MAG: aldo/keto reductase [Bradyrhizobium sp.]
MTIPKLGAMPAIGFGTWPLSGDACRSAVASAIDVGYRHIDTAQMYGNEAEVGDGIRASGIGRSDIFLTTKLWPDRLGAADVPAAVDESLEKLQMDHVDLLLVHWANPKIPMAETLQAFDDVRRSGKARAIGVSNFTTRLLSEAKATGIALFCNQVEFHPYLDQRKVLAATRDAGQWLIGFSPLARGTKGVPAIIGLIAQRRGKTPAQVVLRWALQHDGVAIVAKSSGKERQRENIAIFDFELNEAEMAHISSLHDGTRVVNLDVAPAWD